MNEYSTRACDSTNVVVTINCKQVAHGILFGNVSVLQGFEVGGSLQNRRNRWLNWGFYREIVRHGFKG